MHTIYDHFGYCKKSSHINVSSSEEELKNDFGCIPPEKWNITRVANYAVEIVCWTKDYDNTISPKELAKNPIIRGIRENNVTVIDEKKKTITIEIYMYFIWRDERIRAIFRSKNFGVFRLPPTTGMISVLPFGFLYFQKQVTKSSDELV